MTVGIQHPGLPVSMLMSSTSDDLLHVHVLDVNVLRLSKLEGFVNGVKEVDEDFWYVFSLCSRFV